MNWYHIMTAAELEARHALTAKLDPAFAARERKFWETRTESQLLVLQSQAWFADDRGGYQMASAYLALARNRIACVDGSTTEFVGVDADGLATYRNPTGFGF